MCPARQTRFSNDVCAKDRPHIVKADSESMVCGKCGQPHPSRGVYEDGKIILLSGDGKRDKKRCCRQAVLHPNAGNQTEGSSRNAGALPTEPPPAIAGPGWAWRPCHAVCAPRQREGRRTMERVRATDSKSVTSTIPLRASIVLYSGGRSARNRWGGLRVLGCPRWGHTGGVAGSCTQVSASYPRARISWIWAA